MQPGPVRRAPKHRRDSHRRRKDWTAAELRAFLASTVEHRHHDGFWLAANTGMRRSELLGLRWRDVDFGYRRLSIVRTVVCVGTKTEVSPGKTRTSARTIDLDPGTIEVLADWRERHRNQFGGYDINGDCSPNRTASCFTPRRCHRPSNGRSPRPICRRSACTGLRHTHATLLLKEGVPLKVVSERLGHSTPAFTMATYRHVLPGMQGQAAATFAALLNPAA